MKKKITFSSAIVLSSIAAVVVYTVACFVAACAGLMVSDTLTTAWFSFWGVEIIALASIKRTKTKHNKQEDESYDI